MTNGARLAIVIVTYNSRNHIGGCLDALTRQPPSTSHEIVLVDNASTDGTLELVRQCWPHLRVIAAPGNVGFARANNIGIRQTGGDLILLLNPDTVPRERAIDTLVDALKADVNVAAVGARLVNGQGRPELSFGSMMSPLSELRQKVLVIGHARRWPILVGMVERATRRGADVDWVSGACLLVHRPDAEAVGLLDERFFMYAEDVDFCASLRARGRRIRFVPAAEVLHLRGQSRATASVATEAAYRRSQLAFYAKHHPRWLPVLRAYLKSRGKLADKS